MSVVLVDDDAGLRLMFGTLLRRSGRFTVVGEAGDGVEALRTIARTAPQLVVLDLQMPRLDGYGVLARLAAHGTAPAVVVLSGEPDLAAREPELRALGAAAALSKLHAASNLPQALLHAVAAAEAAASSGAQLQ